MNESLDGARREIETWRVDYNYVRPHSSFDYEPPSPAAPAQRKERNPEVLIGPRMSSLPWYSTGEHVRLPADISPTRSTASLSMSIGIGGDARRAQWHGRRGQRGPAPLPRSATARKWLILRGVNWSRRADLNR